MIDRLSNKVAIVTGGGSGFGEAISERFVAEGANVLVVDIDQSAGSEVAQRLGENARFFHADVAV